MRGSNNVAPFNLAGSLSSALDDEALTEALRDLRKAWGDAPSRKRNL